LIAQVLNQHTFCTEEIPLSEVTTDETIQSISLQEKFGLGKDEVERKKELATLHLHIRMYTE
jgi:hypothetical protein